MKDNQDMYSFGENNKKELYIAVPNIIISNPVLTREQRGLAIYLYSIQQRISDEIGMLQTPMLSYQHLTNMLYYDGRAAQRKIIIEGLEKLRKEGHIIIKSHTRQSHTRQSHARQGHDMITIFFEDPRSRYTLLSTESLKKIIRFNKNQTILHLMALYATIAQKIDSVPKGTGVNTYSTLKNLGERMNVNKNTIKKDVATLVEQEVIAKITVVLNSGSKNRRQYLTHFSNRSKLTEYAKGELAVGTISAMYYAENNNGKQED